MELHIHDTQCIPARFLWCKTHTGQNNQFLGPFDHSDIFLQITFYTKIKLLGCNSLSHRELRRAKYS